MGQSVSRNDDAPGPSGDRRTRIAETARGGAAVIADQGVVSATNFATIVLVGRFGSQSELGLYSLGFWLVMTMIAVQESLAVLPYTVFVYRRDDGDRKVFAGNCMLYAMLLSMATAGLFAVAATVSTLFGGPLPPNVLWALSVAAPFMLAREYVRRFALAHLDVVGAIHPDTVLAILQLGGLCALVWTGNLTAATALWVIAAACSIACLVGWMRQRDRITLTWSKIGDDLGSNWKFGRWILAGNVATTLQPFCVLWFLTEVHGAQTAGMLAACLSAIQLANPFVLGAANYLAPEASRTAAARDGALGGLAGRAILLMLTILVPFCVLLFFVGGWLVQTVYGSEYIGVANIVRILIPFLLASAVIVVLDQILRAANRPQAAAKAQILGLSVTVAVGAMAITLWRETGGAMSLTAGQIAVAISCLVAFSVIPDLFPKRNAVDVQHPAVPASPGQEPANL